MIRRLASTRYLTSFTHLCIGMLLFCGAALTGCESLQKTPIAPLNAADTQAADTQPIALLATAPAQDPTLGQGDEIEVTVYRQDDLTRRIIVPPSGMVNYPLVGDVSVHGLTPEQFRKKLAEGLGDFVKDPQVSVRLVTIRSQNFTVLGEVAQPGLYDAVGATNALQAVTKAGGFSITARRQVVLIRPVGDKSEAFVLDLGRALRDGDMRGNIAVAPGDILFVPSSSLAEIDRFSDHVMKWLAPLLGTETSMLLGHELFLRFTGQSTAAVVVGGK